MSTVLAQVNDDTIGSGQFRNGQNIAFLDLSHNSIHNITALCELKNIRYIDFRWNRVTDITPLLDLKNIRELYLHKNQITDITALKDLKNILLLNPYFYYREGGIKKKKCRTLQPLPSTFGARSIFDQSMGRPIRRPYCKKTGRRQVFPAR